MTQCERVLKYMDDFGSISAVEAMNDLGVMRLASRIHELTRMGTPISKTMVEGRNRYGETVRYMRYSKGA